MAPHTLDARGTGTAVLQESEVSPASLWASPRPSQRGPVPPLKPTPALPRGPQELEGLGRWEWLGEPIWVQRQSPIQWPLPCPGPCLALQWAHISALPWSGGSPHAVRVKACSLHTAPSCPQSETALQPGPHPSTHPRVRVLSGGARKSLLGSGTPSHGETGWAPPLPPALRLRLHPVRGTKCLLSREHCPAVDPRLCLWSGQAVSRTPGSSHCLLGLTRGQVHTRFEPHVRSLRVGVDNIATVFTAWCRPEPPAPLPPGWAPSLRGCPAR